MAPGTRSHPITALLNLSTAEHNTNELKHRISNLSPAEISEAFHLFIYNAVSDTW